MIRISSKRFKSLVKKEVKLKAKDSNHLHNNANPSWRISEEIEARIQITYTAIRIHESGVMKNKARRFESSSYRFESFLKLKLKVEGQTKRFKSSNYGFESLISTKLKYYKDDLNHLHSDSNPSFCRSIKCSTYSNNNSIFNSNLFHNG